MYETTFLKLMRDGGWVMWPLLGFSITAMAVSVQRVFVLRRASGKAAPLLARIHSRLERGGTPARAAAVCRESASAVSRLLLAGLSRGEDDRERLEDHLEAVAVAELRRLSFGLGLLAATAATAPLLGFLGTVTGMMESFGSIVENGMSRPDLVALGIKEALTTTAAGLAIAVPTQLAYQGLRGRVSQLEGELEAAANGLLDLLYRPRRPAGEAVS